MESTPATVGRTEAPPRWDPPHILWYFGAIAAAATATATVFAVSPSARGSYQLLVGLLFAGAFAATAGLLLQRGRRVPGGVLVVATVGMVPAVGHAFERLIGVWPDVANDSLTVIEEFRGAWLALALATVAAGLIAFALVGFPFLFAAVTFAVVVGAQLLVPAFVDEPTLNDRAGAFIVTGVVLLLVALVLDSVARGEEAFWWHVVGLLALAVGLTWYGFFRQADWAWLTMLVVGAVLVLASAPFNRATWTAYGVLGVFGATTNYASDWFGSWRSSALLTAVSVGLILLGLALSLDTRDWSARLPRRVAPPPDPPPPAADDGEQQL